MKKKIFTRAGAAASLAAMLLFAAACGRTGPAATDGSYGKEEWMEVSCLVEQFSSQKPDRENPWFQGLEERYQMKLTVQSIPTLSFADKFSYWLNSDEIPTIVMANGTIMASGVVNEAVEAEMFWCLDDYIDDYPNLKSFIGATAFENLKINGHIYGIPRLRTLPRNTGYYRKDWADSLGLKAPETLEELSDMLVRFTKEDPDRNGLADTMGLVNCWNQWGNRGWNGMQMITVILGGPNGWRYEDGEMKPDFTSQEWMEMLSFFRDLYQKGCMNQDFAVLNAVQRQNAIINGKTGMIFGVIEDVVGLEKSLKKQDPDAELALLPVLSEAEGMEPYLNSTSGNNGMVMFSRTGKLAAQTEEELRRLLAVYDDLCTDEGQDFLLNGIEGIHYTVDENGKKTVQKDENGESILQKEAGDLIQIMPMNGYDQINDDQAWHDKLRDEIETRSSCLVQDDSLGLISDTYLEKFDQLNEVIREAGVRYIIGEIDEEGYRKACDAWYQAGGGAVIREYTQAFEDGQNHR